MRTAAPKTTLSVCCFTSGRRPLLLAAVLAPFREIADEIVVAVEEQRAEEVHQAAASVADKVVSFPRTAPADRPIPLLFGSCSGTWILNVDDDEVPSPALVRALPRFVRRTDITHAWVARRWLYPTLDTYLGAPPWGTEFQLRLVLADDRFLQFSDVFHRPLVCHGPCGYVAEPLWHLDAVLNPAAWRRHKARAYELERPGMRFAGLAHNIGLYVPELHADPDLREVPAEDREAIAAAVAARTPPDGPPRAALVRTSAADVDAGWPGPPYPESLYRATLSVEEPPRALLAGEQYTVDVEIVNGSEHTWRWGADARPEIRLGYRWRRDGETVPEPRALRTTLPADLSPGGHALVPVHVVAPVAPGSYELELDLVHDPDRWFGAGARFSIDVRARSTVAVVAPAERVPAVVADLPPEVEPVVVLRDAAARAAYGDYRSVLGLRSWLLGADRRSRAETLGRLLWRTALLAARRHAGSGELLDVRRSSEALLVGGADWPDDAAFTREWWTLAATALLWRLGSRGVHVPDSALPAGAGSRGAAVRWALRRLRTSKTPHSASGDAVGRRPR